MKRFYDMVFSIPMLTKKTEDGFRFSTLYCFGEHQFVEFAPHIKSNFLGFVKAAEHLFISAMDFVFFYQSCAV